MALGWNRSRKSRATLQGGNSARGRAKVLQIAGLGRDPGRSLPAGGHLDDARADHGDRGHRPHQHPGHELHGQRRRAVHGHDRLGRPDAADRRHDRARRRWVPVEGTHTYAEDGRYTVSVQIIDTADATSVSNTTTATVGEAVLTSTGANFTEPENAPPPSPPATFTDPGSPDPAPLPTPPRSTGATAPGHARPGRRRGGQLLRHRRTHLRATRAASPSPRPSSRTTTPGSRSRPAARRRSPRPTSSPTGRS